MLDKFTGIFKQLSNDPRKKKSWQGTIGIAIFTLFVLSTLVVNQSVQALNQAAGNYGYYGGTYGYNASTTSSDAVPSAPTSFSSSVTQTTATLSWTAPTTTTASTVISTGSGSISSYKFHYSTSSLSSCSGGTSSTPTSASTSLTGLTAGTTYYVAICATDNNSNESTALTGSFTTQSTGGGTSTVSGGGSAAPTGPTYPTAVPAAPAVPPAVTSPAVPPGLPVAVSRVADVANVANVLAAVSARRNTVAEGQSATRVDSSVRELRVTLTAEARTAAINFVTYGISTATVRLGSGERLALVRDQLETLGRISPVALEQLATGQKPTERNLSKERAQLANVLTVFQKIAGHRPNFRIVKEDLAWNTMMYRVRFTRDLTKERAGIAKFRQVFRRTPTSPLDWAAVRAWGYALR